MSDSTTSDIRAENAARIESWRDFMDLPITLDIRLGRTSLTARNVMELGLQSIVRLQRSTAEGVDVLIGGKHIARGEIIIIEDRTGVRINEVVKPKG